MSVEDVLRNVSLFQELQPKQIKSLAKWTSRRTFQPGQTIVEEGRTGLGLYCIESGRVRVTLNTPSGPRELRQMGPGESFGELALLDNQPRTATVTAIDTTTAILLDKGQFLAELRTYPEIALAILPVLVGWLREAHRQSTDVSDS